MVTSRVSYSSMQYEIAHHKERILAPLQEFSRLRIDTREPNMPVLYVAMATWIPKCNMYQYNSEPEASKPEIEEMETDATATNPLDNSLENKETSEETCIELEESKDAELKDVSDNDTSESLDSSSKLDNTLDSSQLDNTASSSKLDETIDKTKPSKVIDLNITPKKAMSPKQMQKRLESEKKRLEKQMEREERERKRQEEKQRLQQEKLKQKQEKEEQKRKEQELKQKEKEMKEEQKRKEKEEREQKRKEKEEKEEQKRKEREAEKLKRQQELDEKNKEKQKQEEQMQKSKAAFANFFVSKKPEAGDEKKAETSESSAFMPFAVKSDMKLAPVYRRLLTDDEKENLTQSLEAQNETKCFLAELKGGKVTGKSERTWPLGDSSDDVVLVEENLGEAIVEQKSKLEKMRAKFLKFEENQRPPYHGTWRKRSKNINPRNPFKLDEELLNYEVDSDEEWEEEEDGESLKGSDDEEKEVESDNDYEVDNEFFVPHGHLSDDEIDDEENAKMSPESHKAKLKLLKNEFDEEMKSKTQKIKPRLIGCIWYDKNHKIVEEAIDRYLQPFRMLCNGPVTILSRDDPAFNPENNKGVLGKEFVPAFLQLIHGNKNKKKLLINEFISYLNGKGAVCSMSKVALSKQLKKFAQWMKCPDKSIGKNRFCWYVKEDVQKEYNVDLPLPNQWSYVSKNVNDSIN